MARVDLRCTSCAYMFFVSDVQLAKPEGVKCPSCMAPVGISGPTADGPRKKTVRVLAAGPDRGDSRMKLYLGIGAGGVVILLAILFMVFSGGSRRDDDVSRMFKPAESSSTPKPIARDTGKPAPLVKPAPAPYTAPKPPPGPAPRPVPVPDAPAAAPTKTDLPEDVVKGLRTDVLSLKEWHLNLMLSAPEKSRLDALLSAGKGEPGDVEFLRGVLTGPRLRSVREEAEQIAQTLAKLEKEAIESLPVDKILMNDGRVLHGKIVEETADVVKMERKFAGGVAGVMPLPRPGIKEVLKGKGLGGEFKTRWEGSRKGGSAALVGLLTWCKDATLPLQASLTAYAILAEEPGRTEARQEAGLASDPVSRMLEAEKQGGFITHEGRRWVPAELKAKLLRDGFVLMDGQWMSRKERIISVPGLFRYESQSDKPVGITGAIAHDEVITYGVVQDLATNSFVEKPETKLMRRFYAAAPMTVAGSRSAGPSTSEVDSIIVTDKAYPSQGAAMRGEVVLTIPVGVPILDASVMTSAEVKPGSSIAVSLVIDGTRIPLYNCGSKEDNSHKLPDAIRGKTEVQIVADISTRASYRAKNERKRVRGLKKDGNSVLQRALDMVYNQLVPEYGAVLFPSNSNTVEVFRLTVATADPSPGLDRLFENAKGVLVK